MSTQVYLSTLPRKNWLRLVPFSQMISRALDQGGIVDAERPALAGDEVLGLVEAEGAQGAEAAQADLAACARLNAPMAWAASSTRSSPCGGRDP